MHEDFQFTIIVRKVRTFLIVLEYYMVNKVQLLNHIHGLLITSVRGIEEEALRPPRTHMNMYEPSQTCPNMSKHTLDSRTCTNLFQRPSGDLCAPPAVFGQFASIWDDPHQYSDHLYTFYIDPEQPNLNRDHFWLHSHTGLVVWGLARGTLENSLWFSLARCKSFFCFSLVILHFGFLLQVLSLQTLIIRLPIHL
jgi:hypothetical protein